MFMFLMLLASVTRAQSILLPVETTSPPYFISSTCAGLQVYDVASRRLIRHHRDLGCVLAIVANGPARAIAVAYSSGERYGSIELQEVDFDHGAMLSRTPLGLLPYPESVELRRIDADNVLVVATASGPQRLVRLRRQTGQWQIVAEVTSPGDYILASDGDRIALATRTPGTSQVEIRAVDDLALERTLTLDLPGPTNYVGASFVRGDRLYAWVVEPYIATTLTIYDTTTGALIGGRPWAFRFPYRLSFDGASRLATTRTTRLGPNIGDPIRTEFVAVSLDAGSAHVVGAIEGPWVYGHPAAHGIDAYFVEQEPVWCFTGLCSAHAPVSIHHAAGGSVAHIGGEPLFPEPGSVQFVGAPLGNLPAHPVPTMGAFLAAILAVSMVWIAGIERRRRLPCTRRTPPVAVTRATAR